MPPFRERLGTGCTKDSKDSGIDVRLNQSINNNKNMLKAKKKKHHRQKKQLNYVEKQRQFVEDAIVLGLWLLVLHLVNVIFGIPTYILWPAKINHVAIVGCYLLVFVWVFNAFTYFLFYKKPNVRWNSAFPINYMISWFFLICGLISFYNCAYPQLQEWGLVVVVVYFLFFLNINNTFL